MQLFLRQLRISVNYLVVYEIVYNLYLLSSVYFFLKKLAASYNNIVNLVYNVFSLYTYINREKLQNTLRFFPLKSTLFTIGREIT